MAAKQGAGKLNLGAMIKAHAKDETDYGQDFSALPPGISGGVAKLVEAKIGVYKTGDNQGEKFVYLAGVVIEPTEHTFVPKIWDPKKDNGPNKPKGGIIALDPQTQRTEGRRTSLMLPMCQTKNTKNEVSTVDENVAAMCNEVRKLGGQECLEGIDTEEDLLGLFEQLKGPDAAAIFFAFSTSAGNPSPEYPEPRTFERWYGNKGLENYEVEERSDVKDETGGKTTVAAGTNGTTAAAKGAAKQAAVDPDEVDKSDIDSLLNRANDAEEKAQIALKDLMLAAGHTEEDYDNCKTWDEVATMAKTPKKAPAPKGPAAKKK